MLSYICQLSPLWVGPSYIFSTTMSCCLQSKKLRRGGGTLNPLFTVKLLKSLLTYDNRHKSMYLKQQLCIFFISFKMDSKTVVIFFVSISFFLGENLAAAAAEQCFISGECTNSLHVDFLPADYEVSSIYLGQCFPTCQSLRGKH